MPVHNRFVRHPRHQMNDVNPGRKTTSKGLSSTSIALITAIGGVVVSALASFVYQRLMSGSNGSVVEYKYLLVFVYLLVFQ